MKLQEIIKYCKKDNQVAQGLLFEHFYTPMFNLSMRMLGSRFDVEEVLSVVFVKIFKSVHKFTYKNEASVYKWIKTITINESIRFLNKRKKLVFEENLDTVKDSIEDLDVDDLSINMNDVYHVLENMPDGYRTVFNLYAIEEYSHREIAEILNISINTSKSQVRKARLFIVERIKKKDLYGYA